LAFFQQLLVLSPEAASPKPLFRCQHPGSPGWPQQFWKFLNFSQLLRKSSRIFSVQGSGPAKLVKKAWGLGRGFFSWHMAALPNA